MRLALDDPILWGVIFVLVFVVEVLIVANMKGKQQRATYQAPGQAAQLAEGETLTDLLSRFVDRPDGTRIGETVGMDGRLVIVKEPAKAAYLAIPRSLLERTGEAYRLTGEVDWDAAKEGGAAWRERQHKLVTYTADELPKDDGEDAP